MHKTRFYLFNPIAAVIRKWQFRHLYGKFRDHTMITKSVFQANLELILQFKSVEGDVIECGTWKGGMIGALAQLLGNDKSYYLVDSFEGLPDVKEIDGAAAKMWQEDKNSDSYYDNCKAEPEDAEKAMIMSGAKDYYIIKGWFKDVLPTLKPKNGFSIIRLDGDWYDSTMESMENLFPILNKGGVVIVDDYKAWDGCSRAIHDYISQNKLTVRIREFRDNVTYIVKI